MKILILDRDKMASQMMASKLESEGHDVHCEASKSMAADHVSKTNYHVIFLDPSPMRDARALMLNIKRHTHNLPYTILLTSEEDVHFSDVMGMGCNDYIIKPIDHKELLEKIDNTKRLDALFTQLSDTETDFPSMGGVISKSAFHQLCLTAMERGGRYNELAFILAISIQNFDEIKRMDGDYHAQYSVSKLAHHMVALRRQSDIIGQTADNEYSILLQRGIHNNEAMNAAKRFAAAFDEIDDFLPEGGNPISIQFSLMHLPTGMIYFDHSLSKR